MFTEKINRKINNLEKLKLQESAFLKAVEIIKTAVKNNSKILFCGNGGSASDANHLAAEFVAKFKLERKAYPALSLCANNSIITAIANDYSFDDIFKRQIEALGKKDDVLIAISTSAKSKNVLNAVAQAKKQGLKTIFLTGENKTTEADCTICAPSVNTDEIQEMHIALGHLLCETIEKEIN